MKHTELPWYVTGSSLKGTVHSEVNHKLVVPHGDSDNKMKNAEFIVRACNVYYKREAALNDLVEAAKEVLITLDRHRDLYVPGYYDLKQAIDKATK